MERAAFAPHETVFRKPTWPPARDRGSPHDDERSIADVQIDYMLNGPPGGVRESFSFSSDEEEGLEPNDPGSPHGSEQAVTDVQLLSFLGDVFDEPEELRGPNDATLPQQSLRDVSETQMASAPAISLAEQERLKALPEELKTVAEAFPRLPAEAKNGPAYARRLHELSQRGEPLARVGDQPLSTAQLALLCGVQIGELNRDLKLKPLPTELKSVAEAYPRLPAEAKNGAAYARRLHELSQRGEPLARVGDQPLNLAQLTLLSGVPERHLKMDPKLKPLPEALKPVAEAFPRRPAEANNNSAYARRLHELSQRGEPLARVGNQALDMAQLALLSGVNERQLNKDPKLKPLPVELKQVADAYPRLPQEAKKDLAYALRLHELSQRGEPLARVGDQPLSMAQLALLSGVPEANLKQNAKLKPPPEGLKRVAEAFPRLPEEGNNGSAYARRLHELSQRGEPLARVGNQPLSTAQLALLSGVAKWNLDQDPKLKPLPGELKTVAEAYPRLPAEGNKDLTYALRLHGLSQRGEPLARVGDQPLSMAQLALLSGVPERHLRQHPKLKPLPQELKRVAEAFPRLPEEADKATAYARRLHELSQLGEEPLARVDNQPLSVAQLALLSGVPEWNLKKALGLT